MSEPNENRPSKPDEEVTPAVVKSQWSYECEAHGLPIIRHQVLPGPSLPRRMCAKCIDPQHGKGETS